MAKQSQVKARRKLNPVFHLQTKEEDDTQLTRGMIKVVRRTGQLNLSGRNLVTVPDKMFCMYDIPTEESLRSCDISKTPDDPWWSFKPLTYIDLSSNVLTNIPDQIKIFEDLTTLNLQDNCLTALPQEIGSLTKLTKLNISHNKINTLPQNFYKLTELQQLFLAHNCLEELTDDFGDLIMLQQLDLSHNNLTRLSPGIGFLVRLTELNLSYNKLKELPPDIVSIRALQKLDVTHNDLRSLPKLLDLRKLHSLYAQHNDIEELPDIEACDSLRELYFGNNFIKEIPKEFCEEIAQLNVLDLRDNKIQTLPDEIAMLQQLIRLDLSNNELECLPNTLSLLPHLQNLQVEGNILKQIRSDVIKAGTSRILKHLHEKLDVDLHPNHFQNANSSPRSECTYPDKYTMRNSKALSLGMHDLTRIPDDVFNDAKDAEVNIVDLCKNKLSSVPEGLRIIGANITELNLSTNQLKEIPEFISECVKLQYLDLGKNILDNLPAGLADLKWLRELVISHNRFVKIPTCVYQIESLEILLANDNQIIEIEVCDSGFERLKRLAVLNLANNNINHIPPVLGNLKHIRSIELMGNSFRQPRYSILEQGTETIMSYLRDRIPK